MEEEWQLAHKVIDPYKAQWAIDSFDSFKSLSPDGIFQALLKWEGKDLSEGWLSSWGIDMWQDSGETSKLSLYENQVKKLITQILNPSEQ